MNTQELFDLRKKRVLTFGNPLDLTEFLDNLFVEEVKFPLVAGYDRFPDKEWKVIELAPKTTDDELTVRNYLQGQRQFKDYWKMDKDAPELLTPIFSSILLYPGVDEQRNDELVFGIQMGFTNSSRNRCLGGYSIYLQNQGRTYGARTETTESMLAKIMKAHLGPK